MARANLAHHQLPYRRMCVALERRWPLCPVLLAPLQPILVDISLCAFFEGWRRDRGGLDLGFPAGRALGLDDIDAGAHQLPRLAASINDQLTIDRIGELVARLEAEKTALHPEQK